MPALEVLDTVVLIANRQLVGIVDRTHYENNDPLQDILIIAHIDVDDAALAEFVTTGTPPKDYVFVRFSDEAQGNSLVREDDVILLDRNFNLGDVVKQKGQHMLGTVVNVVEKFTIQPVWLATNETIDGSQTAIPADTKFHTSTHVCSIECPFGVLADIEHPLQSSLLRDIPGEELRKAEDALEGDYIIHNEWVGVAEELVLMVIILLEDGSIVVVKEPDELYIPVMDSGRPLVSLPEFDNLARPDPLVALQGWSATIPPHDFQCGQMVVTNHKNLKRGRWLLGQYNPDVKPQGRILDVRTKSMDVRWLACNAFTQQSPVTIDRPPSRTLLYENIGTFPKRSELRSNKQVTIYDHSKLPRITEDHTRKEDNPYQGPVTSLPTDFRVGDHVKFRDPTGAALKYQGTTSPSNMLHGKFDRIASASVCGFDLNEFKIICGWQGVIVVWQDGTFSSHSSTDLTKFFLFEPDLAPADIVVAREGMKQAPKSYGYDAHVESLTDFNEMKFFEQPHDLLPRRVGIVQNVNQAERVAQVRWFEHPHITITNYGNVLSAKSRFGKLSNVTEDVSLYEIMTFQALTCRLKDLVIVPPETILASTMALMTRYSQAARLGNGQTSLAQINAYGAHDLLQWLQPVAIATMQGSTIPRIRDDAGSGSYAPIDWVGQIVRIGLDGILTVRLNTRGLCKDIRLEHDQIICLIDEASIGGMDPNLDHEDGSNDSGMDFSMDGSDGMVSASTISETVEYEGGERIDNDSGDENWEDAEEEEPLSGTRIPVKPWPVDSGPRPPASAGVEGVEVSGGTDANGLTEAKNADRNRPSISSGSSSSLFELASHLLSSPPAPFSVLEQEPPADQFQGSKDCITSSSSTFLKRVAKEHRILSSSLPAGEIFVRTYETRLDLMRCLIVGPADTPYEHAPFLIDLQLGKNFPREPPVAHFHSWTSGLGRINPNLYEEGKICLSLLGTWPGKAENEGWSEKATILQLLVSLQGLVFVRQPFYNEAGFEGYADDQAYRLEAQRYNEKAYVMARGFVKHAVTEPVQGLEDVLAWIYLPHNSRPGLLRTVINRSNDLIESSSKDEREEELVDGTGSKDDQTKVFLKALSRGAIVMLGKTIRSLEKLILTNTNRDVQMPDAHE